MGLALALAIAAGAWFGAGALVRRAQAGLMPPVPDLSALTDAGRAQVLEQVAAVRADRTDGNRYGELGRAYQANLLIAPAMDAYARARRLAPDDWRWAYHHALLLEERGDQAGALALLTEVTRLEPRHGLAWFRMGEMAFKDRRLDDAERAYVRARAEGSLAFGDARAPGAPSRRAPPLEAYADLGVARVALDRGDRPRALERLRAVLDAYPDFGTARALLVQAGDMEQPAAARGPAPPVEPLRAYVPPVDPWLETIVERSFNSDLLLKHAAMANRGGDDAWREYLLRRAVAANPEALDVRLEMASMLQASGREAEALASLADAERLAPGDHQVLVEQGRALAGLGRLDEAEAVLRRAVRVRDAAAEYNLGSVLDRQGRWEEAREHYERAIAIDPFYARAMNNLAVGLDRRGQGAAALALFARALEAAPADAETYSNLGSALIGQRRFPEAIRALDTAIALDSANPNAHNNRGIALAQSGRFAEARTEFEEALRLFPGHVNARRNLDRIRVR